MQQERRKLSLRREEPEDRPVDEIVAAAISARKCVIATYNKARILLAPHILYTKHGDHHVDGVVLERDGQPPRERKVGTFKLTGLSEVSTRARPFDPINDFDPAAERYEGVTLAAV